MISSFTQNEALSEEDNRAEFERLAAVRRAKHRRQMWWAENFLYLGFAVVSVIVTQLLIRAFIYLQLSLYVFILSSVFSAACITLFLLCKEVRKRVKNKA